MATGNINQQSRMNSIDDYDTEEEEDDPSAMSLVDHLEELRWRIFKSLIAITVGAIIAFIFREQIVHFLEYPLPVAADVIGKKPIVTGITEGFTVFLMLSIAVGFIIALPVVLYQTWAFIAPGLLEKEKKMPSPSYSLGLHFSQPALH